MEIQSTQQLVELPDQPMEKSDELLKKQQHHRPLELMDLPTDLLYLIFRKYLTIRDLLQCRLVNRRSQSICDASIKELIITPLDEDYFPLYWFMSDSRPIEYNDAVTFKMIKPLRPSLELSVKRLFIESRYPYNEDHLLIQFVNSLSLLEELTICRIGCKAVIELKNLKIIEIINFRYEIELRTPKLEYMKLSGENVEVIYPLSIKHLVVEMCNIKMDVVNKIKLMANLEHLELTDESGCYDWLEVLVENDPSTMFSNLRQLRICFNDLDYLIEDDFFTQWIKKSMRNLKIYVECVELVDLDVLSTARSCETSLEFQLINYKYLIKNDSVTLFNYSILESVLDKVPKDIFDKFPAIRRVEARGKIKCAEEFFWFLKNTKKLKKLYMWNTELDQAFFDQLPPLDDLQNLEVRGESTRSLNWDFILRLPNLFTFGTDFSPASGLFQLASKALKQINRLTRLEYYGDELSFRIRKFMGKYDFACTRSNNTRVVNLTDIDLSRFESICEMLDRCRDWPSLENKINTFA